ncbi:MAG: hypothetical protein JJT82_01920 [Legionellaceae bacterium]|nr:hypothetical protein [Legionellaceae bacterium]
MKFLVTYTAIDSEYANPLWHSFLMFSTAKEGKKIKVVDHFGFYAVPSSNRNSWLNWLSSRIGLDIDLQGNHGVLRTEELRFLDMGAALHGVTFELTEEKFQHLREQCQRLKREEQDAIDEVVLTQKIKPGEKTRMYPYEAYSRLIFEQEKIKAAQNNRPPRLKPFEINLSLTFWGPTLNQSHTCKTQILSLLESVLSAEQINRLTEQGKHRALPKYSGPMESIYLHSSGPLHAHQKSSGKTVYYRDWADQDEVELHWTLPPQEIEALSEDTIQRFTISPDYCQDIKEVIHKLQRLEWLFINAQLPAQYTSYQAYLIEHIRKLYQAFSIPEPSENSAPLHGWQAYAFSLFGWPKTKQEQQCLQQINRAKQLFNSLYMAIVDHWQIEDGYPCDIANTTHAESDTNPLEAIATYLSLSEQQQLCLIIGRRYYAPRIEDSEKMAL